MAKQLQPRLGISIERARTETRSRTVLRVFWIFFIAALVNGLVYAAWVWTHSGGEIAFETKEEYSGAGTPPAAVETPRPAETEKTAPAFAGAEPSPQAAVTPEAIAPAPAKSAAPRVASVEPQSSPIARKHVEHPVATPVAVSTPRTARAIAAVTPMPISTPVRASAPSSTRLAAAPSPRPVATSKPAPIISKTTPVVKATPVRAVAVATTKTPKEVRLKKPVELSVRRDGKLTGFINLKAGQTVKVLARKGESFEIGWGDGTGSVKAVDTE